MSREPLVVQFDRASRRFPERAAVRAGNAELTYAQLAKCVDAWVRELEKLGFAAQEHVLIAAGEPLDFIAAWLALWRAGCIPIPMEASVAPAELARAVAESQAHRLITRAAVTMEQLPIVEAARSAVQPALVHARLSPDAAEEAPADSALFFYTSGTTGVPKCVVFSQAAMAENVASLAETIGLVEQDVLLTPLSAMLPATLATAVLPALCVGATLVLPAQPVPGHVLQKVASARATVFFAVPYIYKLLAAAMPRRGPEVWQSVRLCLSSSAFLDGHLFDTFYRLSGLPIRSVYCSSEAGACTFNDAEDLALVRDSVGRALPGVELQVVDGDGHGVAAGETGEIVIRGSHVASGYYRRPELTRQVFGAGCVRTGDLGALDAACYLRLAGRLSDTINISGHLVSPAEVEQVLLSHPAVTEALVYGVPDPQWGESVAAKVVLAGGARLADAGELSRLCADVLVHYKVPRHIELVPMLPKSRYGKVERGGGQA